MTALPDPLAEAQRRLQARQFAEAAALCRQLLQSDDRNAAAHHLLGLALRDDNQTQEAIASFRRAAELEPEHPIYHSDLANLLTLQGRPGEALPHYRAAVRLQPEEAAHHSNLGNVLVVLGYPEEAEQCCREALRLRPDLANGYHNLAIALGCLGRLDEAIALNAEAIRLEPGHAGANNCQALWALQKGDFERGWREYHWRWDIPYAQRRPWDRPAWDGTPLEGRTILVHAEQGLGDTIQFIRYARLVKERGGRVIVECQPVLIPLLQSAAGIDQLVARDAPLPPHDVQVPLLDLPRLFHTTLETVPADVPYLAPRPELAAYWKRELGEGPALKIGLAWQGNPQFPGDTLRSIALEEFAPLGRRRGVRLFSLQKGTGREQLGKALSLFHITDLASRLDREGAFLDTAAVMRNLDLVVTSDTAIAHLAGALGVPVWVALGIGADWRFLMDREDSPWYPTMRLFRQKQLRDWPEVFERIVAALPVRDESAPAPAEVARRWLTAQEDFDSGCLAGAASHAAELTSQEPCHAEGWNLRGVLAHRSGDNERAAEYLRRAIHLDPDNAGYHYNLGVALQVFGRLDDAADQYRHVVRLQPRHVDAHHNLGMLLRQQGRMDEALTHSRAAVELRPDHAGAFNNLGLIYVTKDDLEQAAVCFRKAVDLQPDFALARNNLVVAHCKLETSYRGQGKLAEARHHLDEALRLQPTPELRFAAATLLPPIYQSVDEIRTWRRRLEENLRKLGEQDVAELQREVPTLFYLTYQGENDRDLQRAAGRLFHAPPLPARKRHRSKKIRIGFVSRFFKEHTITELFGNTITQLSRERFRVSILSIGDHNDPTTRRLREQVDRYVALSDTDLGKAREQLAAEELDILFFTDVGMEPISYALAFTRYAPVQCVTWGHPITTGLPTIDYFVSSELLETEEADAHYTETLVRLRELPSCFARPVLPTPLPGREQLGLPESAHVYGCPQSLFKLHPEFDAILGGILRQDPDGVAALLHGQHAHWDELLLQRFAATIPDVRDRVLFLPRLSRSDFLSLLARCDVLLDPIHFGGGNTSYQGLAFGTPIITLPSPYLRGRITQALYRRIGVLDCIVHSPGEYVAKAVKLACDRGYREEVRTRILAANAVLYDNSAGVRALEEFFEQAWAKAAHATEPAVSSPSPDGRLLQQALVCFEKGERDQATACCEQVLQQDPEHAEANHLRGVLASQAGDQERAVEYLRKAVHRAPENANFQFNLGVALQMLKRTDEAMRSYEAALAREPEHANAHHNLGFALAERKQWDEAERHYRAALRANPSHLEAHHNLALLLRELGRLAEAVKHFRETVRLNPGYVKARHNLGLALTGLGRYAEALAEYEEVLAAHPEEAETRFCRSLIWLLQGDFERGWPEYEWRWQSRLAPQHRATEPAWDGSRLDGKTILLHGEQGLGDTLQFVRYASLVKERGGRVVVECQPELTALVASCPGIERVVAVGEARPPCDCQAPLLSLPRIFHTSEATIPATVPYLRPDAALVSQWRERLKDIQGFKIGIVWQGSPTHLWDRSRSIPLSRFAPLARVPGVTLISLQRGRGREQLDELAGQFPVTDLRESLPEASTTFADTAAVVKNLDLVISADTAVAHLAGALGVPVWVALPLAPDFRWLLEREDSPWYPTMRLFRQTSAGEWESVFERMAAALRRLAAAETVRRKMNAALDHFQSGRGAEAERACREVLELDPDHADALNVLAVLAHQADRAEEAVGWLRRAIAGHPSEATLHYNLAVGLHALGRLGEAVLGYRESLRLRPAHADSHNNLGHALAEQGRFEEAVTHFAQAVEFEPRFVEAHNNWALALAALGKPEEALERCEQALCLNPDHADAHVTRAMIWLRQGDLERGWAEYEWRWRYGPNAGRGAGGSRPRLVPPQLAQPPWDGSPLHGRTILLHAEQGLGDTLHFIRYAALVKARGGRVLAACGRNLVPLVKTCPGIDEVLETGSPLPPFDVHAPLLSLPRILGTTLETIPASVPYLSADAERVEAWSKELRAYPGFKIGIIWQCDSRYDRGGRRSVPLRQFAGLAEVPGVRQISLQKGTGTEHLREARGAFAVIDFTDRLDEGGAAFQDTAAMMKNLDLVITVDTSVAHLAGALGVPVWMAIPVGADWRWLLEREDSPWYPTMRVFRQTRSGDWDSVFGRMARELRKRLQLPPLSLPVRVEVATGELLDKIAILEIKSQRIENSAKLRNVAAELQALHAERERSVEPSERLEALTAELKAVNERLWDVGEAIRECERRQEFGPRFVELARSLYRENDRRTALKRRISETAGSRLIEEKSHDAYEATTGLATICILTFGDYLPYFRRCLESVLATTPRDAIELRLGFNDAPASFAYACERLGMNPSSPETTCLNGTVKRYAFATPEGLTVRLWDSSVNLYKEPMARLLYHDVPLTTEYAIWLDDDSYVEPGWWEALVPRLDERLDYLGQLWWVDYWPGQEEMIQAQPWYRGVPFQVREGRPGIWFMTGGFLAVRAARLRETRFPDTEYRWKGDSLKQYGGDTLLGEIAHQLGWSQAVHDQHIRVNVDLQGNHPAPRRGGTGRQFGSDVDVVIR